jgi:predicted peptidase
MTGSFPRRDFVGVKGDLLEIRTTKIKVKKGAEWKMRLRMLESAILIWVCAFAVACTADEQMVAGRFAARMYKNARGETMPYRIFVPANYDRSHKYPLVLWLHGFNGRGNDNMRQITAGNALGSQVWTRAENQQRFPSFVVAPQSPDGVWANTEKQEKADALQLALEIVDAVRNEFNIDTQRIYVMGQSMGGSGTWDALARRPELFAAALVLCGLNDPAMAARIASIPVWVFHGEADQTVPVTASRSMVEALRAAGAQPKYTEYPGVGHEVWEKAFAEPGVVEWVMGQKRK